MGVERQHPVLVGEQRIDLELDHLGEVDDQLRDLDQRQGDVVDGSGRVAAEALQQPEQPGAHHRLVRQMHVQRRQRQGGVGDHRRRGAAVAEQDHRPELRIFPHAHDQLEGARPLDHRLHHEAVDAGVGPLLAHPPGHRLGGIADRRRRPEVEHDAAHLATCWRCRATGSSATTGPASAAAAAAAASRVRPPSRVGTTGMR